MFLVTVDPSSRVNVQVSVLLSTVARSLVPGVGLVPSYPPMFCTKKYEISVLVSKLGPTKTERAFLLVVVPSTLSPAPTLKIWLVEL